MTDLKSSVLAVLVSVPECVPFSTELNLKPTKYEIGGNLNVNSRLMSLKVNFHICICIYFLFVT